MIDPRIKPEIFAQKVPCDSCPFRREGGVKHGMRMATDYIAYHITKPGATFPCHKSVPKTDDRQSWSAWQDGQVLCAGGLIFAAKLGLENGVMEMGRELGWYNPEAFTYEDRATVFDSIDEMLDAHDAMLDERP